MRLRYFSHFVFFLQVISFPFQFKLVPTLAIGQRII